MSVMRVVMSDDVEEFVYLEECGLDTLSDPSIFHLAAKCNAARIVQHLLRSGIDVNAADVCGSTALHKAAAAGRVLIVQILLDHGANPQLRDIDGRTALFDAEYREHETVIRQLVNAGLQRDE